MRHPLAVVAAIIAVAAALPSRNLTGPAINPGWDKYEEPCVVVTAAENANNTLHHLWGTNGTLSFVVVAGTGGPHVTVDWEAFRNRTPESITFEKEPSHVFGFVIPSLILYNDVDDDGAFQGQNTSVVRVPISNFTWSAEVLPSPSHQVAVMLQTTHYRNIPLPNNTRLSLQVSAYGEDGRSTVLPHLLYTPDSAQLELILDNFNLNITNETSEWENARWGMDVMVFSSEYMTGEAEQEDFAIKLHTQKSLDDEHTPGVFDLDQITTAGARTENKPGGYLQWRPVSYLSTDREISSATTPNLTPFHKLSNLTDPLKTSLAYAVLGNKLILPDAAITTVISFGQPKDGFYRSENFATWTVAVGEGGPPQEGFSTVIIVVISLGVVLPGAMFLVGCVVLAARRCRRRSSSASTLVIAEE